MKAGGGICAAEDARLLAAKRTAEELSWRPEPIVEEPIVEEIVEQPQELIAPQEDLFAEQPVVEEQPVEMQQLVNEYVENPVVEETQKVTIPELENEKVTDGKSKEGKTFDDYVLDVFCFLMEIYIVVGSVWGLIRLIKLIFGK